MSKALSTRLSLDPMALKEVQDSGPALQSSTPPHHHSPSRVQPCGYSPTPGLFKFLYTTNPRNADLLAFWMDSQIFLPGVFVWRIKLFDTHFWCKKETMLVLIKLVFHPWRSQRELSFAISVSFSPCPFMNVSTVSDWYGSRSGLRGNNRLSCKQLKLYCTFPHFLKRTFLAYLVLRYPLFVYGSV